MKAMLQQSRYPADAVVPENGRPREQGARPQEGSLYEHLNRVRAHLLSSKREAVKIIEKVDILDELKKAGVDTRRLKVLMSSADERGKQSLQRLRENFRRPKESIFAQYFANRAKASLLPASIVALSPVFSQSLSNMNLLGTESDDSKADDGNQTDMKQFVVAAKGSGSGYNWAFGDSDCEGGGASFSFKFMPPETKIFRLNVNLYLQGHYVLVSNDTACTLKTANASLTTDIQATQQVPNQQYNLVSEYDDDAWSAGGDNINVMDSLSRIVTVTRDVLLYKGGETDIWVDIWCEARARGEGAVAEVHFDGPGEGLTCEMHVT
jgi:hypothetical protein